MVVLCCRCGVQLARKDCSGRSGTSHGLCPSCKARLILRTASERRDSSRPRKEAEGRFAALSAFEKILH